MNETLTAPVSFHPTAVRVFGDLLFHMLEEQFHFQLDALTRAQLKLLVRTLLMVVVHWVPLLLRLAGVVRTTKQGRTPPGVLP